MKQTPVEKKLTEYIDPVVQDHGFELVWIHVFGEGGSKTVQVMAQDPETRNLGVDDAAKISRAISAVLDVEDPIDGKYRLEVSSPGIDRLLFKLKDFDAYKGFEVKLETSVPTETGQKRFRGRITEVKGENILLSTEQGEVEIPFSTLHKAKLVLTDELIKAAANF